MIYISQLFATIMSKAPETPPKTKSVPEMIRVDQPYVTPSAGVQTTLTQVFDLAASDDEETFAFARKRKSEVVEDKKPAATKKKRHPLRTTIVNLKHKMKPGHDFKIGDLVMTTAGELHHPARYNKVISPSYIVLGVVTGFRMRPEADHGLCDPEYLDVHWQNVQGNGVMYHDKKDGRTRNPENLHSVSVKFDYVHCEKLRLVAPRDNCRLNKMNGYIQAEAWNNFSTEA